MIGKSQAIDGQARFDENSIWESGTICLEPTAGVAELADASDSKSDEG